MPREQILDIGDERYSIGLLSAEDGSWVLGRVLDAMRSAMLSAMRAVDGITFPDSDGKEPESPKPDEQLENAVRAFWTDAQRKDIKEVQKIALGVTRKLVGGEEQRVPLLMQDGRYTDESLAFDFTLVMTLTSAVMKFNLSPFFERGGLAAILQGSSR